MTLFKLVKNRGDFEELQRDLTKLGEWGNAASDEILLTNER